jgi:hypothetical protein
MAEVGKARALAPLLHVGDQVNEITGKRYWLAVACHRPRIRFKSEGTEVEDWRGGECSEAVARRQPPRRFSV